MKGQADFGNPEGSAVRIYYLGEVGKMARLGGKIFTESDDPRDIARAHRASGYRAAFCPPVSLDDEERIRDIAYAFEQEDVVIAEVEAWCNLIGPDEAGQQQSFDYVCERLALADEIGARCCIAVSGSVAASPSSFYYEPHEDNLSQRGFDLTVETVRSIIDAVKPKRAKFCLELMQFLLPDSAESYLQLIRAVDREAFAAHVDPVNIIVSPRQYFNNALLIAEFFKLLGPWIVGGHAKDIRLRRELALHFEEVIPGQGNLDYKVYLRELNKLSKDFSLLLEHLNSQEEYAQARNYIVAVGRTENISF